MDLQRARQESERLELSNQIGMLSREVSYSKIQSVYVAYADDACPSDAGRASDEHCAAHRAGCSALRCTADQRLADYAAACLGDIKTSGSKTEIVAAQRHKSTADWRRTIKPANIRQNQSTCSGQAQSPTRACPSAAQYGTDGSKHIRQTTTATEYCWTAYNLDADQWPDISAAQVKCHNSDICALF